MCASPSPHRDDLHVDLAALRAFADALDAEILGSIDATHPLLHAKFFPNGQAAPHSFGKHHTDPATAHIGPTQTENIKRHLETLAHTRTVIEVMRDAARELAALYQSRDDDHRLLVDSALTDIREP